MTRCGNRHQTGRRIARQREALPCMHPANAFVLENAIQGSAGGSGSMFMFQRKSLCRIHSRAAHTAGQQHQESRHCWAGGSTRGPCVPTLCPHSLSLLPLTVLCPHPTSQLCVLVLCPSSMFLPCIPVPGPCPVSLPRVPALQTLVTQASYCRTEERSVSQLHVPSWTMPSRARPGQTFQGSGGGETGRASGGARPEPAPLGRIQEPIYMQMSLLIKDKRRNEQKPPSTRAEAFSPDAFQSC